MMMILCLLVKLVFFVLACNIQCTITTEEACLNCWSNLCRRPIGSSADCTGNSCTDMSFGVLISGLTAEQCCEYASSYVSSSITNGSILMSNPSPSTEQCTAEQYNEFPTGSIDDLETISNTNADKQFILYDTVRFNCSGCVKTISIYTGLPIVTTYVSTLQIWSTNTLNNQTLLKLKQEIAFELFNGDSVEVPGGNTFLRNTREINESLCFNASDVFGIKMPTDLGETVLTNKSTGNVKTYARDSPSCDSLEKVYLLNSDDIVPNIIINVEVTANPEPSQPSESSSTSSSSVQTSASLNTQATVSMATPLSSDRPSMSTSMKAIDQLSTQDSTFTSSKGGSSISMASVSIASSSSPIPPTPPPFLRIVYTVAGIVLFIVVLLVIVGLVIGITLYIRAKRYIKDANGFEMIGHTGRNSVNDMLDFQTRTVSPSGHHLGMVNSAGGSTATSQFSTPVHTYQHPKSSFQQSNYYDDPTALDTSRLDITKSRDYLPDSPDYTTMNSDVGVARHTPTSITGSRSTVSDNSYRRNLQQLHYDVPRSGGGGGNVNNSHYDEPTALDIPVGGTLDPYSQPFSEVNDGSGQRVNHNRQYFVLEQDTVQRMTNNPQIPIYHVLEKGYHVPSAQERGDMPKFETERLNNQPFFEEQPQYWEPAEKTESIYDQLSEKKCRELKRDDIMLVEELGGGQFGTVWSGVWTLKGGVKKSVAVKVCKENAQEQEKARLLREGARMMQFFHTHVVQLYGVVTIDEPLYLVIELMNRGDLKEYLRSCSPIVGSQPILTNKQLLKFCRDVATGMRHLAKKKFVHRDLAARNIMLNEQLVCKIGDFGMTRAANHNYDLTKPEQIPLRWTAPEALKHRQYSEKSDVYSYGMLMFEIWSLGLNPFPAQENNQLIINFISRGRIMPPPPGCPREMYRLMAHCWHPNPNERPSFENCSDFLSSDDNPLLQWNTEDYSEQPPEVKELGTGVQHGFLLFMDLQHQYRTEEY